MASKICSVLLSPNFLTKEANKELPHMSVVSVKKCLLFVFDTCSLF